MFAKKIPLSFIFILLIAFALRVYQLAEIPPGLTHDEADHAYEAVGVMAGVWRLYFPLGSGREPLYSYLLATAMAVGGRNLFVFRYVIVLFNLLAVAATHRWAQRVFDKRTAILTSGLFAVSFWAVSASRQALRSGLLPFFAAGSVLCFWLAINHSQPTARRKRLYLAGFVFFLTSMLYTYMAARIYWALFPAFVMYLALFHWDMFQRAWGFLLSGLALVAALVSPLFIHLQRNPELETRLGMLTGPLDALRDGNALPLLTNIWESLAGLILNGMGDSFLAYNIPGRPVFMAVTAVFFTIGILISVWQWRKPAYALLIMWFVVGISPSLVTGVMASTTRNVAAMPAMFLLPAVGFTAVADWVTKRLETGNWRLKKSWPPASNLRSSIILIAVAWLAIVGGGTARDYFVHWGEAPDVRGAYQHTLVEEFAYLEQNKIAVPIVLSTVYPGPAHDPAISLILSPDDSSEIRWVDARFALLFPEGGDGRILIPNSTPIHPALRDFVTQIDTVSLRPDDLDAGFELFELNAERLAQWGNTPIANFDNAITLRTAEWLMPNAAPGGVAELLTVWEVRDPLRVGPLAYPLDTTDMNLFTQVLDSPNAILTQQDALHAPSGSWQTGDIILQIHTLVIPPETAPGSYQTIVGLYDKVSEERRPVTTTTGDIVATYAVVPPLQIVKND